MTLIASFNYTEPSLLVVLIGTLAALAALVVIGFLKRIFFGMFVGALSGAAIAWVVLGKGSGDLVGLMQLIGAPVCGLVGAGLGGLAAFSGKMIWKSRGHITDKPGVAEKHAPPVKPGYAKNNIAAIVILLLIIGALGFFHIVKTDNGFTLIPKEHFTFSMTFTSTKEVIDRHNNRKPGDALRGDPVLDHLVRELETGGYISH